MAGSDGQVVFTIEMDDTAFQAGMLRLNAALDALAVSVTAALSGSGAQLGEALALGGKWADTVAAGIGASRAPANAARNSVTVAANGAKAAAGAGGAAVGRNLVAGMASGALAESGTLNAALARVVQAAVDAAKRAAGISSPSRLFRDEVGRYLALGLQSGFETAMDESVLPGVAKSVGRSAQQARAALPAADGWAQPTELAALSGRAAAQWAAPAAAATQPTTALAGEPVVQLTQHITFAAAMQAPDEIARAIRRQTTYGLAGSRG